MRFLTEETPEETGFHFLRRHQNIPFSALLGSLKPRLI